MKSVNDNFPIDKEIIKRISYHEAGHAVAFLAAGIDVKRIEIDGYDFSGDCYPVDKRPSIKKNLIADLAGMLAERRIMVDGRLPVTPARKDLVFAVFSAWGNPILLLAGYVWAKRFVEEDSNWKKISLLGEYLYKCVVEYMRKNSSVDKETPLYAGKEEISAVLKFADRMKGPASYFLNDGGFNLIRKEVDRAEREAAELV